jgi:membrane protein DedA with SNARE-associated domain
MDYILGILGTVVVGGLFWLAIIFVIALLTEIAFPGACPFLETLLILAGFKIAQGAQVHTFVPLIVTAYGGRICGSTALYWVSAFPGGRLLNKLNSHFRTARVSLRWVRWKLSKAALPVIIISRFTPGFGIASTVTCGISRIEYRKFFAALTIHILAWEAIFLAFGALGGGVSRIFNFFSCPWFLVTWIIVTLVLGASLGFLFFRHTRARLQSGSIEK